MDDDINKDGMINGGTTATTDTSFSGIHGLLWQGASALDDFFRFMEPRDTSVML